jgi:beta-glucosidase
VAQLYVHPEHPSVSRPEKELKGFKKVFLKPGEKQSVSIPLTQSAFAYYSTEQKTWVAEKGGYQILLGASSRDLPLQAKFQLENTSLVK